MAVGNLTLNGRTFTFSQDQNGILTWFEVGGGVPSAFGVVTSNLRWNKDRESGRTLYRQESVILLPVVAAEDSECLCEGDVIRNLRHQGVTTWDAASNTVERTAGSDVVSDYYASSVWLNQVINSVRPT